MKRRPEVLSARERVSEFLRQWERFRDKPDSIYAVHSDPNADVADLLASDLRLIVTDEGTQP